MAKAILSATYGKYNKRPHSNRYIYDTWYTFVHPGNNDTKFEFGSNNGFINISSPGKVGYIYPHGFGKDEVIFGVKIGVNNYSEIGIVFDYVNKDNYYYYAFTPDRVYFGRYVDGKNNILFTKVYPHPAFDYHFIMVKIKNGVATLFETDGWFYFDVVHEHKLEGTITGSYGFYVNNVDKAEIVEVTEYDVDTFGITKELDVANGQEYKITELLQEEVINYCNNSNIDYESVFYMESSIISDDPEFDVLFDNGTNYTSKQTASILLIPRTKIVLEQPQVNIEVLSATKTKITFNHIKFADEYVLTDGLFNTITVIDPTQTRYIIENLEPATSYLFYLTAKSNTGLMSNPAEIQFTTKPAPEYIPNPPHLVSVINISSDSVTYAWERIPDVDGYVIQDESGNVITILQPDITQYTETGLIPGQDITRYIVSYNLVGYSEPGQPLTFTIPEEIELVDVVPVSKFYGVPIATNAIRWEWEYTQTCDSFIILDENDNVLTVLACDKRAFTEINLQQSKEYTRKIIAVYNGSQSVPVTATCSTLTQQQPKTSTVFEYQPVQDVAPGVTKPGIGDLNDIKGEVTYVPLDTFDIKVKYIPRKFATPIPDYEGDLDIPQNIDGIVIADDTNVQLHDTTGTSPTGSGTTRTGYGYGYGHGYRFSYGYGYNYGYGYSAGYGTGYSYGSYGYGYSGYGYGGYYGWLSGSYYGNWYGLLYGSSYSSYGWWHGWGIGGGISGSWNFIFGLGGSWVGGYILDVDYWNAFRGQPSFSGMTIIDNTTGEDISNKIYYYPRIDFEYKIDITEYKEMQQKDGYITKAEVIEYPEGKVDITVRAYKDEPIEVQYQYDVKYTLGKGHEPRPPAFDYKEVIVQVPENSLPDTEETLYVSATVENIRSMYFDVDLTLTINAKLTPIESRKESIKVLLLLTETQRVLKNMYEMINNDDRIKRKIYLTAIRPADTYDGQYNVIYDNVELNEDVIDSLGNGNWNNNWYLTFISLLNDLPQLIQTYNPDVLIISDSHLSSSFDNKISDSNLELAKNLILNNNILFVYDTPFTDRKYYLNKLRKLGGYFGSSFCWQYSSCYPYLIKLLFNIDYTPFEYRNIFRLPCYTQNYFDTYENQWDPRFPFDMRSDIKKEIEKQLNGYGILFFINAVTTVLEYKLNQVMTTSEQNEIIDKLNVLGFGKVSVKKGNAYDPVTGYIEEVYHVTFVDKINETPIYIRVMPVFKSLDFKIKTKLKVNLKNIEYTYPYKPWKTGVDITTEDIKYDDPDKVYYVKYGHINYLAHLYDYDSYKEFVNRIENKYLIRKDYYRISIFWNKLQAEHYPNVVGGIAYRSEYLYYPYYAYQMKCILFVHRTDYSIKTKLYDHKTYNNYFPEDKCDVNSSIEIQFGLQPDEGYRLIDRFIYTVPWTEDDGKEYGYGVIIEGTDPDENGLYTKYLARLTFYAYSNEDPQYYEFFHYPDGIKYATLLSYPYGKNHDQKFELINPFTIEEVCVCKIIENASTQLTIADITTRCSLTRPLSNVTTPDFSTWYFNNYGIQNTFALGTTNIQKYYFALVNTVDPGLTIYKTKPAESFTYSSLNNPILVKTINYQTDFADDIAEILSSHSEYKEVTRIDIINVRPLNYDIYQNLYEFIFDVKYADSSTCEIWCHGYLNTVYQDYREINGVIYNYEGEKTLDCSVLKPSRFDGEYTGNDITYELVVKEKTDNIKIVVLPDNTEITEPGTYTITRDTKVVIYNTESYLIDTLENIYLPPQFVYRRDYLPNKQRGIFMFKILRDEEGRLLADNIEVRWTYNYESPQDDYHYMPEVLRSVTVPSTLYIRPGIKTYSIPIYSTTEWMSGHVNGVKPVLYNYDGYEPFTVLITPYLTDINNRFDVQVMIRSATVENEVKYIAAGYHVTFYSDYVQLVDRDVVPESITY